jgi:thioredoxin 1
MIEANKGNFIEEVINSDKPVIVDFWGPACQPCLKLMPDVEEFSKTYGDRIKFVKVNSSENRRVCIDRRVMGLPTFLVFKDGEEIKRISGGDISKTDLESLILENI